MKLTLLKTSAVGLAICAVMVFAISEERRPLLMLVNFGAFAAIFLGGSIFCLALLTILRKIRRRTANKESTLPRTARAGDLLASLRFMIVFLLGFSVYFYDNSSPREIAWGDQFRYTYRQPEQTGDGWSTSTLEAEGLQPAVFEHLLRDLVTHDEYKGIHSLLIARHGKLVLEEYFYDQHKDLPHPLRSANKSLTSALIGIALDEGLIRSVDDPIVSYFPEIRHSPRWDTAKEAITIRHLLTMSGGLDANDWDRDSPGNEERLYALEESWTQFYLDLPQVHPPGEVYAYSTGGEMVLRDLITRVSGISLQEYAASRLLAPLGITSTAWHRYAYGRDDLPVRLDLTSREMLKLGQVYLDDGIWNGRAVISPAWVRESTALSQTVPDKGLGDPGYGYLWWKHHFEVDAQPVDSYAAQGSGGQFIFVVPAVDMVVVFTQGNYQSRRRTNPLRLMREVILPSL